jgi:hypothetical protein
MSGKDPLLDLAGSECLGCEDSLRSPILSLEGWQQNVTPCHYNSRWLPILRRNRIPVVGHFSCNSVIFFLQAEFVNAYLDFDFPRT